MDGNQNYSETLTYISQSKHCHPQIVTGTFHSQIFYQFCTTSSSQSFQETKVVCISHRANVRTTLYTINLIRWIYLDSLVTCIQHWFHLRDFITWILNGKKKNFWKHLMFSIPISFIYGKFYLIFHLKQ